MNNEYIKLFALLVIVLIALALALCLFNHLNISLGSGLIGGITGALITGFFTVFAVNEQHRNIKELEDKKEKNLIDSSIKAMQTELETLWKIYEQRIGIDIRSTSSNNGINFIFPIQLDYFTVYNTNARLIGKFEPPIIRRKLIETYTDAKGLIDSLLLNNQMCISFNNYNDQYESTKKWGFFHRGRTKNDYYQKRSEEVKKEMIRYAGQIKFLDRKVEADIKELNKLIDEKN